MPDYLATLPYCGTVAFLLRTKPVSSLAFRHADTRTQWHRDFGYGRDEICYGLARGRVLMEPLATPPGRESPSKWALIRPQRRISYRPWPPECGSEGPCSPSVPRSVPWWRWPGSFCAYLGARPASLPLRSRDIRVPPACLSAFWILHPHTHSSTTPVLPLRLVFDCLVQSFFHSPSF